MNTMTINPYVAFVGIDWADTNMTSAFKQPIAFKESLLLFLIKLKKLMSGRSHYINAFPVQLPLP